MSSRSSASRCDRIAMATPAILLFVFSCVAQIIAEFGGRRNGQSMVRGSGVEVTDDDKIIVDHSTEGGVSLEHHHGHRNPDHSKSQGNNARDNSFDSYVYSMSYQPEFCRENNEKFVGCHNFMESWAGQLTIHGLWPNRDDGTWPSSCTNEQLNLSLLEDLSDELAQRWPNVKASSTSPGHASFWAHEWSKHGTCSGLSQHQYFAKALDLLVPTPSTVKANYGSVVNREELEEGYLASDTKPVFVCKYGYLSEVRVCLEKAEGGTVGKRVACPVAVLKQDSCGDEIKIASFDTRVPTVIA